MHPNLSFDQAPPISVPLRFFLAAPWFGAAAGILFAVAGIDAMASRWTTTALALTHLLTAGFMLQVMAGALFQFIPVATGGNVWRPQLIATAVQPLFVVGLVLLCVGFLRHDPTVFRLAAPVFMLGVGILAIALLAALWRTPGTGETLAALRIAVAGLAVTAGIGTTLAEGLARDLSLPYVALTDLHMAWGLGAWSLVLVAGASFYVVPMFQLTAPYPMWLARRFAPAMLAATLLWTALTLSGQTAVAVVPGLAMLLLAAVYAAVTLRLQYRRRRRVSDVTLELFRFTMLCLLAAAVVGGAAMLGMDADVLRSAPLFGVLALAGVFVSAINGMLYKIVPFISWLHLQRCGATLARVKLVPNMGAMIPETAMQWQARLHMVSVLLLALAIWIPAISGIAGTLFAASCAWLGWNLIGAARRYVGFRDRLRAYAPVASS